MCNTESIQRRLKHPSVKDGPSRTKETGAYISTTGSPGRESRRRLLACPCVSNTRRLFLPWQVDCITVSLFPFKASIEDQLQRLVDALTLSLRNTMLSNFKAVDVFLEESMEKLGKRPRTIDDIAEVHMLPFFSISSTPRDLLHPHL